VSLTALLRRNAAAKPCHYGQGEAEQAAKKACSMRLEAMEN